MLGEYTTFKFHSSPRGSHCDWQDFFQLSLKEAAVVHHGNVVSVQHLEMWKYCGTPQPRMA